MALVAAIAFVGFVGPLLELPVRVQVLALEHVTRMPVADFDVVS